MPIVHPATYARRPKPRKKRRLLASAICLLILTGLVNCLRPLPATVATIHLPATDAIVQTPIDWPPVGQAAIGAAGYGVLATKGTQNPVPTASVAKVITALCILQKRPLIPGQAGPTYTVGPADIATYNTYATQNGSVIRVQQDEQLSEYQALQALMIPSANNIADSLVRWEFGSQAAYASYATAYLTQHELTHTHIGTDASGFDPSTTSTASDLTRLGLLALQSPVLMQIAGQKQVTLPVVGSVQNYNTVLGTNGITGLKTGNSDADNGAFIFTATYHVGGKDVLLAGAVMNALSLDSALQSSVNLAAATEQGFTQTSVAGAGQVIGAVHAPWGASAPIVTAHAVQLIRWKSTPIVETHQLNSAAHSGVIGSLKVVSGQASAAATLQLGHDLPQPSFWWRLTRH